VAALEAGRPPDFAFGYDLIEYDARWAFEDRLVDLTDPIGHFADLFDPNQLDRAVLLNATTRQKALYGLPIGQISNYVHVWKSLLEPAEAANVMLTRAGRLSSLKRWALAVAGRRGMKRAKVALARKLASVLHRMWLDGTGFRFGKEVAAA
jgi:hypothetical protein